MYSSMSVSTRLHRYQYQYWQVSSWLLAWLLMATRQPRHGVNSIFRLRSHVSCDLCLRTGGLGAQVGRACLQHLLAP